MKEIIFKWWFIWLFWFPIFAFFAVIVNMKFIDYQIMNDKRYKVVKTKKNIFKKFYGFLLNNLVMVIHCFIPIWNFMLLMTVLTKGEHLKERTIEEALEKGNLVKID